MMGVSCHALIRRKHRASRWGNLDFTARTYLKHGILALSSNYAPHADKSNRVMCILSRYAPRQEVYSIDESFLDFTGVSKLTDVSYAMRERVLKWTGIPVCVDIDLRETLAKLANFEPSVSFEGMSVDLRNRELFRS
jgi:nucleotidyltransferase/DNA polymerase involved in DNA repair